MRTNTIRRKPTPYFLKFLRRNNIPLPHSFHRVPSYNICSIPFLLAVAVIICILGPLIAHSHIYKSHHSTEFEITNSRQLLGNSPCYPDATGPGFAILAFVGALYMFVALSVVVDEFFVPSLECIAADLDISNDVAGATLMAAGGSAPELFTSFFGTFQRSPVGFAAIVGSAVFNVLFVIGACAMAAPRPLELTWWPLFRDCVYYAFGLGVLSLFFSVISPMVIEWWEALILFSLYIGYVCFMKYNKRAKECVVKCLNIGETEFTDTEAAHMTERIVARESVRGSLRSVANGGGRRPSVAAQFRMGLLNMMIRKDWNVRDIIDIGIVTQIMGDVEQTFRTLDTNGSGYIEAEELAPLLNTLDTQVSKEVLDALVVELDTDKDGRISFEEFSKWYIQSEQRVIKDLQKLFCFFDFDDTNVLFCSEVKALLVASGLEADIAESEAHNAFNTSKIIDLEKGGMSFEQFKDWYIRTPYFQERMDKAKTEASQTEGIEELLEFPETFKSRFWWCLTIPLVYAFIYSIPDVRKPDKRKLAPVAFIVSILWIGIFSYAMVIWTEILGDTLQIPVVVMGLTFLAAGTSVPDLLSSVIVAKQGHGDMAISSSIGSNIFDILVGLPLPWMCFAAVYQTTVSVEAKSLEISVLVLLGMLIAVVVSIIVSKWRMTKKLGWAMFLLYFVFVAQDLARAKWGCSD